MIRTLRDRIGVLLLVMVVGGRLAEAQTLVRVCASGCQYGLTQIQQAVDAAQPGWIIEISAGQTATTAAGLVLRNKGTLVGPYITIRSSGVADLPQGKRVKPADKPKMATITFTQNGGTTMLTDMSAAFYRFEGIEFTVPARRDCEWPWIGHRSSYAAARPSI